MHRGHKCQGSTIHREVGEALITPAGPEIGVAATKTFMAQITVLSHSYWVSTFKNEK